MAKEKPRNIAASIRQRRRGRTHQVVASAAASVSGRKPVLPPRLTSRAGRRPVFSQRRARNESAKGVVNRRGGDYLATGNHSEPAFLERRALDEAGCLA